MSDSVAQALIGAIAIGREIEALASERASDACPVATGSPLATAAAFFAGVIALSRAVEARTASTANEPAPDSRRMGDGGWLR